MDAQALWVIILSIATPVAGIVGFAIQLRQVKKTRLENEKLQLEIQALRAAAAAKDSRIVRPTTEEVVRFTRPMPSAASPAEHEGPAKSRFTEVVLRSLAVAAVLLVLYYLGYDIYRLVRWLAGAL